MAVEQGSKRQYAVDTLKKWSGQAGVSQDAAEVRRQLTPPLTGEQQNSRILRRMYDPYLQYGILSSAEAVLRSAKHDLPDWTQEEITAMQQGPERLEQKRESARRANLARIDALIDKLGD